MKTTMVLTLLLVASTASAWESDHFESPYTHQREAPAAGSWATNPRNWANSGSNWDNSPFNWQNNPRNWANSPNNFAAENGIYAPDGSRQGYAVPRSDGGLNLFDNDGRREGYVPGDEW